HLSYPPPRDLLALHSFPTRRSSDLDISLMLTPVPSFPRLVEIERRIQSLPIIRTLYVRDFRAGVATLAVGLRTPMLPTEVASALDRKSTRLNSSHVSISYAVFCLKK